MGVGRRNSRENSGIPPGPVPDRKGLDATIAEFIYRYDGTFCILSSTRQVKNDITGARGMDLDGFRLELKIFPGRLDRLRKSLG